MWGRVRARGEGTANPAMKTGQVEVYAQEVEILNTSDTPPFQLDEHVSVGEETRLSIATRTCVARRCCTTCVCAPL